MISELVRPRPARVLEDWFEGVPNAALHLSVLTLGEICAGVESAPDQERKERLRLWLEQDLPAWFGDRLLSISAGVADRWGRLVAQAGRPVPAIDSLLAATALHHELRMVTRNVHDFPFPGLTVVNPWERS